MKVLLISVVVFCLVCLAVAKVGDICDFNDDCGEEECCVHIHSYTPSKCKKLRQKDEWCFPDPSSHLIEKEGISKKYKYMCPCVEGLECESERVDVVEDGVIEYRNAKCTS